MKVKTRFAPSPTGLLHIGSVRTALYSWLYARNQGGGFVLRIEDTDSERSTQGAVDSLLEGMHWLGLSWDEGPYYQSSRFDRYNEVIDQLLAEGHAYRCYASEDLLEEVRIEQEAKREHPRYDAKHPKIKAANDRAHEGDPSCIRFLNPAEGSVVFDDKIRGRIEISNSQLDDLVIRRTDGSPTYNFCAVVDDWDMKITHVIRGEDHISNTARQINIYKALGANIPIFAHCSMILDTDGNKLSKRHSAVSVMQYRGEGYLPEALLNYLVRLGWSHGDKEIFSLKEMIERFNLDSISKSASVFNVDRLLSLNHHYIKTLSPGYISDQLPWHLESDGIDKSNGPAIEDVVSLLCKRCHTLAELSQQSRCFYEELAELSSSVAPEKYLNKITKDRLELVLGKAHSLSDWTSKETKTLIKEVCTELNMDMGKVCMPLRVALTGSDRSPPLDTTMMLIGKERSVKRIQMALDFIKKQGKGT